MRLCRILERNITLRVFDAEPPKEAEWDSILPVDHFLRSSTLAALENSDLEGFSSYFIQVFRKENFIGVVYLQRFRFSPRQRLRPFSSVSGGLGLVQQFMGNLETSVLVCGSLFHLGAKGFHFPDPGDNELIFQIIRHFDRRCPESASAVLVKDVEKEPLLMAAGTSGFTSYPGDATMEIPISGSWSGFPDYLAALSKKYRQRANRILEGRAGLNVRFLSFEEVVDFEPEMNALYRQVLNRQDFSIGSLSGKYFREMIHAQPPIFRILGYFDREKLVAFSSLIDHPGNALEIHYIGFDYSENQSRSLYFNILFDGIRLAIEEKKEWLWLGRTGYDAKASAGALPKYGHHFYRIKRGIPSLMFRYFMENLQSKESSDWRNRNPFRSTSLTEIVTA